MIGFVDLCCSKLTTRNRELLSNQAIRPCYVEQLRERLVTVCGVHEIARLEAVYLGPGQALVAADVRMEPGLSGRHHRDALRRSAPTPPARSR